MIFIISEASSKDSAGFSWATIFYTSTSSRAVGCTCLPWTLIAFFFFFFLFTGSTLFLTLSLGGEHGSSFLFFRGTVFVAWVALFRFLGALFKGFRFKCAPFYLCFFSAPEERTLTLQNGVELNYIVLANGILLSVESFSTENGVSSRAIKTIRNWSSLQVPAKEKQLGSTQTAKGPRDKLYVHKLTLLGFMAKSLKSDFVVEIAGSKEFSWPNILLASSFRLWLYIVYASKLTKT